MSTNYAELELSAIRALIKKKKVTKAVLHDIAEQLGLMTTEEMRPLLKDQLQEALNDRLTKREEAEEELEHVEAVIDFKDARETNIMDTLASVINMQEFKKRKRGLTAAQKEAKRKRNRKKHHKALRRRRSNVG